MKRIYEALVKERLADFPCVAIIGPRQCGKTTLLDTLGVEWRRFDLERQSDYSVVSQDPDLFLRLNPRCVAIDESQLLPSLFSALRVAIDDHRAETGRFVITGSSSPSLLHAISESLAGRVAIVEMAPLSFAETRQDFTSSFFDLFFDAAPVLPDWFATLQQRTSLEAIHRYWWLGGYPEPWVKDSSRFRIAWQENYAGTYLRRDVQRLFPGLKHERFARFLQMLGHLSGTILNYSDIARTLGVSQPTARDYVEIAHGTFVWRHLPAFTGNPHKRIVKHPKGYLRDSGLLHYLLRLPGPDALQSHPDMGRYWEGMVTEEILRGLDGRGISYDASHFRTAAGGEVDLVLQGAFGLIPIEIKYAQTVHARELQALEHFIRSTGCPFGIVINNDVQPRLYTERMVGVPFACL